MNLPSNKISSLRFLLLLVFLHLSSTARSQEDLILYGSYTVAKDSIEEYLNVTLRSNNSVLNVEGTLVVQGDLIMDGNFSQFNMGPAARVIIFGDFLTKNKISIDISSYLIIHGNFIKGGSDGQGDLDVDNGNIYIYGEVDNWGDQFETCPEYEGGTGAIEEEACDYGTEDEYIDNQDQFPDDLVDLMNCYDLSAISHQEVCEGNSATFSVPQFSNVTYEWQEKNEDGSWSAIGSNSNTLTLPVVAVADDGRFFRVVVRSLNPDTSACKISISRNVKLSVSSGGIWTGAADSNWNNPGNWSCNLLPTLTTRVTIPKDLARYPKVNSGSAALAKDIIIEAGAALTVENNWLRITGELKNSGTLNAGTGSISFEGTSAQLIPQQAFSGNRIYNLKIDNPAGVTSEAVIEIVTSLKVDSGSFVTGDRLVLLSNASGTAFIDGSGKGEISGVVTMQRYLPNAFGYKYFSTPFQNSVVNDLAANFELINPSTGFPHVYEYLEDRESSSGEDLTGWQKYITPDAALKPGFGYAINPRGVTDPMTLELAGEVNNGLIEIHVENNGGTYTKGFNLIGNPYPSPIDWDLMTPHLQGIENAVYFFKASNDDRYTGTYTSYVNGISTDGRSSNIIPSMQGFFVRVSEPEDGIYPAVANLRFTNNARVGNIFKQPYYRTSEKLYFSEAKKRNLGPEIRLTAAFKGEEDSDAMVIYFADGATQNFEKDQDAQKILNTATDVPSLYSLTGKNERLSINAISGGASGSIEIPLGISAAKSGEMVFALSEESILLPFLNIYLRDDQKKVIANLKEEPVYSFMLRNLETEGRFSLILSSEELSPAQMALMTEDFSAYSLHEEIVVKLKLSANKKGKMILCNMSGQVLQSQVFSGNEVLRFKGITAPGVYLLSMQDADGRTTKKILHKK